MRDLEPRPIGSESTASQKNRRPSRFEKPANCETPFSRTLFRRTLFRRTSFSRTSTTRAGPGRRSLAKNSPADFLVNPTVKTLVDAPHQDTSFVQMSLCQNRSNDT
jgi:hypothetical protein